jgi:hypothetical protein
LGFGVWGLEFRVHNLQFTVEGLRMRDSGSDSGCRSRLEREGRGFLYEMCFNARNILNCSTFHLRLPVYRVTSRAIPPKKAPLQAPRPLQKKKFRAITRDRRSREGSGMTCRQRRQQLHRHARGPPPLLPSAVGGSLGTGVEGLEDGGACGVARRCGAQSLTPMTR